ncbi:MAG: 3-coathanger stack domain-containing protein, partial [Bacteroidota bacterium]
MVFSIKILNDAPLCYPNSDYGGYWSHDSRLIWPEGCGEHVGENKEYVGLDYMMLHNLYYVAMRKEDFLLIELFSNEDLPFVSQYYNIPVHAGIIKAYNQLTEEVSSGNMEYIARNRIELKPGFRSGEGVEFSARVEPRPGFYQGRKYNKLNVNQCNEKI